jgi:hypothetical protein
LYSTIFSEDFMSKFIKVTRHYPEHEFLRKSLIPICDIAHVLEFPAATEIHLKNQPGNLKCIRVLENIDKIEQLIQASEDK